MITVLSLRTCPVELCSDCAILHVTYDPDSDCYVLLYHSDLYIFPEYTDIISKAKDLGLIFDIVEIS